MAFLDRHGVETFYTLIKNLFVRKEDGKGLSSNDYTTTEKTKLGSIEDSANNYTLPTASGTTLGGVKIGSNITMTTGTLSVEHDNIINALGYTPTTSDTTYTLTQADGKITLTGTDGNHTKIDSYKLPSATTTTLGGVIVGSNLTVLTGTLSITKN